MLSARLVEQCSPTLGCGQRGRAAGVEGEAGQGDFKHLSFRLNDPNSPEYVQPNCGAHCFLTGETGGAGSVPDPAQALCWPENTLFCSFDK